VTNFATSALGVVDLKVSSDGYLYYLARDANGVFRVDFTGNPSPTITQQPADQTAATGQAATFTVAASGTGLTYQWQRAESGTTSFVNISGATSTSYTVTNAQSSDNGDRFRVVVTNTFGSVTSNFATLTVTANQLPTATINLTGGLRSGNFDAGTPITFTGTVSDPEDGTVPISNGTWEVNYITSIGTGMPVVRPLIAPFSGVSGSTFTPDTTGPYTLTDVAYRITLTVIDSQGATRVVTRDVSPNTSTMTLTSNIAGLTLTRDGQPVTAPNSFTSVVGFIRPIGAATTQVLNGVTYNFVSWSDGGGATHDVSTPQTNTTYTANYVAALPSAPSNLSATAVSSSQINLVWADNSSNESGFRLQRATDSGFTQNLVTTNLGPNTTSAQATGLAANTTYYFRVRAVNGTALSAYTATASATTQAAVPAAPSGPTAVAVSASQINLSWTDNASNETGFQLQRATDAGFTQNLVTTSLGPNTTSAQATGLTASTTYYFRVRAVNGAASSAYTATANATTQAGSGTNVKINFQDSTSEGFTGYLADTGKIFADRGNGFSYGWNANNAGTARNRNAAVSPDERYDTLQHMQLNANPNAVWEIAVPNGQYTVRIVAGAPTVWGNNALRTNVEGVLAKNGSTSFSQRWLEATVNVNVTDGRLTVSNAPGAVNNRINFIEISTLGEGGGLAAVYYDNADFTGASVTRTDAGVNFDWASSVPVAGIGADTFSVRWTGKVRPEHTGTYTFLTTSNDGVRLWVDGQLLIDQWNDHEATTHSAMIALTANRLYAIKLEYYENTGLASIKLEWELPGLLSRQIIPSTRLYGS